MNFPERVYTLDELKAARAAIARGFKYDTKVIGDSEFNNKINPIIELVKLNSYWDFLRTYIRDRAGAGGNHRDAAPTEQSAETRQPDPG